MERRFARHGLGRGAKRPNFLKFLGVEAPTGNDLNVLPSEDILVKWILENPEKKPPDPNNPRSFHLHHKPVLASLDYMKVLADIKALFPKLYERLNQTYRWLWDPTIYEEALKNTPMKERERDSNVRLPDEDIDIWIADGKVEEFHGEAKSFMHIFDVIEFFKLRRRGIGEPFINDFIFKLMLAGIRLPTRKDVRAFLHQQTSATPLDAAAFYDQFKLHRDVQQYFVFQHNGKNYALTVLPMGFRPAADVAQLTAEAILTLSKQHHAMAYIDNFIFTGPNQQEDVTRFLDAAKEYGLQINESKDHKWKDDMQKVAFDFLGEQYDLADKTKKSTTKTIGKVTRALEILRSYNSLVSSRTVAAICGILIYASPSHDIPLSAMFPVMRYLSHLGKVTTDWDSPAPPIDNNTLTTLQTWSSMILKNPATPIFSPQPETHDIEIQVDASSWGWGAVIIHSCGRIQTIQKQWPANFNAESSTIAEPMAAWLAVSYASNASIKRILLRSDHLNLVHAIKRGHGLTKSYNDFIHNYRTKFPQLFIDAEHIAGIDNTAADKLSRGLINVNDPSITANIKTEILNKATKRETKG
jgi:hypothetical protein